VFSKNATRKKEINNRVKKSGNIIRSLICILWDESLRKITKETYNTREKRVMIYEAEAKDVSGKNGKKLLATEVGYRLRGSRKGRLDRIRNETI
jgi:hypothetical protein